MIGFYLLRGENWEYNWCQATISKVLKDIVYIGDMENKKYEVLNYKTKKKVKVPKENHIIVQNTHEAIISRGDYDRMQELLTSRKSPNKHNYENVFKSLMFCMECGHRMHIYYKKRKRRTTILYLCPYHTARPDVCTHHNYIRYVNLKELITKEIRVIFETMKNDDKLIELLKQKLAEDDLSMKHKEEKARIEKRLEALVNRTLKIYSDNASGMIDDKTYLLMVNKCQIEQRELNEKLAIINKQMEKNHDFGRRLEHLKEKVN
ncbi:MAG: recombinase family protein [Bacilli bacterium]|nr:recombinase family protein [Bacilli bacterium]